MTMSENPKPTATFTALPEPPRWRMSGPPYQFTREELINILKTAGYELSERQLRSWATAGLIPHPERRLPPGATDGIARALYPKYVVPLLQVLLQFARDGATMAELKALAPEYERMFKRGEGGDDMSPILGTNPPISYVTTTGKQVRRVHTWRRGLRGIERAIETYATRFEEQNGVKLSGATLTLRTEDGQEVTIGFSSKPDETTT
jgi:hypothetical protein